MFAILAATLVLPLCACGASAGSVPPEPNGIVAADYTVAENWISIPGIVHDVDTFYIYPTCYMPVAGDALDICGIDDEGMRKMASANFATNQGAFSEETNVFAPYYRQASVSALQDLDGDTASREILSREPRVDLFAALDYYFENHNGGRPFILAGHSQGSMMIRIILKEYMPEHPECYDRMIAAYPIGYSVTQKDLDDYPHLKFAEGAYDTGVIVSWNTEGPGNGDSRLVLPGAISINPINWKRDGTYAPAEENLGSLIPVDKEGTQEMVRPGVADAQVDPERGVVICANTDYPYIDTSKLADYPVFGEKSLHGYDYTFYYGNIQQNVRDRIDAYFTAHSPQ